MHSRELVELLTDDDAEVLEAHPVDTLVNGRDELDVRGRSPVEDLERLGQHDLGDRTPVPDALEVRPRMALEKRPLVDVQVPIGDADGEVAERVRCDVDAAGDKTVALHRCEGAIVPDDLGDRIRRRHVASSSAMVRDARPDHSLGWSDSGSQLRSCIRRHFPECGQGGALKATILPEHPDAKSPAGADIRFVMACEAGNMIHSTVPPQQVNRATMHATVSELWFVLEGRGEIWRDDGDESCVTALVPGTSVDIPVGTAFQYRNTGDADLTFICVSMPPWPGDSEATYVEGKWPATI